MGGYSMKIVLADDQILFRTMLEEVLSQDAEFEIVGVAANGNEAVELTISKRPEMVLMDIQMPIKSGIDALEEIKSKLPDTKVVMLTTFEDSDNIRDTYLAGADGYLVKDMQPDILKMSLKCIYNNLSVMHRSVHDNLLKNYKNQQNKTIDKKYVFGNIVFSSTDVEIIKLIAEGKTNKEIAIELNYTEGTVKNKVSNIFNITGLSDRTKICVFAIKNNII